MILNPVVKKNVIKLADGESVSVELDLASGDQTVTPAEGKLIEELTIKKPESMTPENIKSGETIGGVVGTYETPTEELSVTANGEYTPPEGKHFSKVTVNVASSGGTEDSDVPSGTGENQLTLVFTAVNTAEPPESINIGISINGADASYYDLAFGEYFTMNNLGFSDNVDIYVPTPGSAVCEMGSGEQEASYNDWMFYDGAVTQINLSGVCSSGYLYIDINYYE